MDVIVANMEILKSDTFRKTGASKSDIKMIADLYGKGKTVEQISVIVNVQEAVVRAFCPVLAEPPVEMEKTLPAASEERSGMFGKVIKKKKR